MQRVVFFFLSFSHIFYLVKKTKVALVNSENFHSLFNKGWVEIVVNTRHSFEAHRPSFWLQVCNSGRWQKRTNISLLNRQPSLRRKNTHSFTIQSTAKIINKSKT